MAYINNHADYVAAVNLTKYYEYKYRVENKPEISDEEYDEKCFAIQEYEKQHPDEVLADSPTQVAGSDGGSHSVPHRIPMLSTQKVKTIEDVKLWMASTAHAVRGKNADILDELFTVEWKYDGISCSLVYVMGELV